MMAKSLAADYCWVRGNEEAAMKIVIIGATGTIGKAVASALGGKNVIVALSRSTGENRVDITNKASIEKAFAAIGKVDAIVCRRRRRIQTARGAF
jgi:5,10-methylene-tetrahydrofolate dehydrogenase/methenyl tetrahydrofolate cyclohydrolase